ncbi:class I SAM-dependent methyltransferase [Oligoflexus tunisiensis]|uniref:class I SAM-dependent methyltransferase n=1 Tax=Oligoflexus tunisiensis TaxID=708132 RepID=UPI000AD72B0D|nr:class I SAM-dependent methyltransferase [Oligoflexus tunisiensis]
MSLSPKAYDTATLEKHAEMLANRAHKVWKKLRPGFEKQNIGVFRIYDRDIPEVRAVVDWYEGHLVLGEYVREQTAGLPYLDILGQALREKFSLAPDQLHMRQRQTRPQDGARYQRLEKKGERLVVREGDLRFWVNLDDYLDTGLFADHRLTRSWVRSESEGRHVLNLYAYTGAFSVYAAKGGAASTTTVDMSENYLDWAWDNFKLNELDDLDRHSAVAEETRLFLRSAAREGRRWDIIILDPPSFSTTRSGQELLEIQRDHPDLINEALAVLRRGGKLYFSTNHQRFQPDFSRVKAGSIEDLTDTSTPIDYEGKTPHRLFVIS